jgi:hypothetical protein
MMNIRELDKPVTIVIPTYDDGTGRNVGARQATGDFIKVKSFAKIESLRASDNWVNYHFENRVSHRVTVRYSDSITYEHGSYVLYRQRKLYVLTVRDDTDPDYVILFCEEKRS